MKISSTKIRSQYNLFRVLRAIWLNHGISRIELCHKLDIDKATMSSIVSHLLFLNIVEEIETAQTAVKPGRKPIGLGVVKDFGFIIGIEYHKKGIKAVLKDLHSNSIQFYEFSENIFKGNIKSAFFHAYAEVKKDIAGKLVLGVGVAFPGVVDSEKGLILNSRTMGIEDEIYDFNREVFENLGVPGFIDNDANCCARGVLTDHRTKEYSNFLYTLINNEFNEDGENNDDSSLGLGFGIVLKGKLYNGPDYTAGEFKPIESSAGSGNQLNLTRGELNHYRGDHRIQNRVFDALASHFALFVNVFNFQHIFIGGEIPPLIPNLKERMVSAINENWLYRNERDCGVHIQKKYEMSPSIGAAGMFLELLFTVPELSHDRGALIWQEIFSDRDLLDY